MMSRILQLTPLFLCVGALVFSFSVAATNVALGAALAIGILSGQWWQGAVRFWLDYRLLLMVFVAYFLLMIIGLIWSQDVAWGVHVLGRQWFWLLIPVVIAVLSDDQWRIRFLMALSVGLTLTLIFCVMQMNGLVEVTTVGSSDSDATGHIGHIGFGVVYGLWGAWLLHVGWLFSGWQRLSLWSLTSWAYLMVFLAQGRAGLLVATLLMIVVVFYNFRKVNITHLMIGFAMFTALVVFSQMVGPNKERWQSAWQGIENNMSTGIVTESASMGSSTDQRFYMAIVSLDIWKQHPVLGVGTGGLPEAVKKWSQEEGHEQGVTFAHPHNQYLLNLVRWGPLGLALLMFLLFIWLRESRHWNWNTSRTAPLICLSAVALASHGLFAPSMEEHFSAVLAALVLGVGLSDRRGHIDSNS